MAERNLTEVHTGNHNCSLYFMTADLLFDQCNKRYTEVCPIGCEGPCFYTAMATGDLQQTDLDHAMKALGTFDAILINEDLDDEKQSDFLSDLTGVPRNASFALKNKEGRNTRVEKSKKLEKISFYRRLLKKLGLEDLTTKLNDMNKLELELYMHAKELNKNMLDQWEKETQSLFIA